MTEIDPHDVQDSDFQNYFALETDTPTNFFRNSATSNPYIKKLLKNSKLQILQETKAINLWRSKGHVGLLHLFLPLDTLNTYRQYTNVEMSNLGPNQDINMKEFMAYIGLEEATSLVPLNQLRQYWSTSMFSGHPDFKKVMSRNRFMSIRGRLVLKADNQSADAQAALDPLFSARRLMNTCAKTFSEVAVPLGM